MDDPPGPLPANRREQACLASCVANCVAAVYLPAYYLRLCLGLLPSAWCHSYRGMSSVSAARRTVVHWCACCTTMKPLALPSWIRGVDVSRHAPAVASVAFDHKLRLWKNTAAV